MMADHFPRWSVKNDPASSGIRRDAGAGMPGPGQRERHSSGERSWSGSDVRSVGAEPPNVTPVTVPSLVGLVVRDARRVGHESGVVIIDFEERQRDGGTDDREP
jgi:hypothetical protein